MTQNTHVDCLSSCWRSVVMVCALLMMSLHVHAAEAPLTFGIFPYVSHQQMVAYYTPLRDCLQQAGGQKFTIITAPDFPTFRDRTREGAYDIILTAPHLARLAEKESGFKRVAITRYRVHGVVVVTKDSPVRQLSDLRGKSLSIPPATSIVHMLALELLRGKGLQPERDFTLHVQQNMQNVLVAPLHGDSDASAVGFASWNGFERQDMLRVIAKTAEVPGLIIMAHPRVSKATIASLRRALFAFGDTAEGKAYFAATKHGAWLPVDDATMRALDPYVRHARE